MLTILKSHLPWSLASVEVYSSCSNWVLWMKLRPSPRNSCPAGLVSDASMSSYLAPAIAITEYLEMKLGEKTSEIR